MPKPPIKLFKGFGQYSRKVMLLNILIFMKMTLWDIFFLLSNMGHKEKSSCCFNELKNDLFIFIVVRGRNHKKAQKIPSNPKSLFEQIFIPCNIFVFLKRSKDWYIKCTFNSQCQGRIMNKMRIIFKQVYIPTIENILIRHVFLPWTFA